MQKPPDTYTKSLKTCTIFNGKIGFFQIVQHWVLPLREQIQCNAWQMIVCFCIILFSFECYKVGYILICLLTVLVYFLL